MKVCNICGHQNMSDTNFCEKCGNRLADSVNAVCPKCGKPLNANDSFCQYCGAPVVKNSSVAISGSSNFAVKESNKPVGARCPKCGAALAQGDAFCPACGANVDSAGNNGQPVVQQINSGKEKGGKGLIAVIIALVIVLLAIVGVVCYFVFFNSDDSDSGDSDKSDRKKTTAVSEYEESTDEESATTTVPETTTRPETTTAPETTTLPTAAEPTTLLRKYHVKTEKGSQIRMRSVPDVSDDKNIICGIPDGTQVDIEEGSETKNGKDKYTWVRVYYNGKWGWVAKDYLVAD